MVHDDCRVKLNEALFRVQYLRTTANEMLDQAEDLLVQVLRDLGGVVGDFPGPMAQPSDEKNLGNL